MQVVQPRFLHGVSVSKNALLEVLKSPIASPALKLLADSDDRIGIIINDKTRITPTRMLFETILSELQVISQDKILIFVGLGTHQTSDVAGLKELV